MYSIYADDVCIYNDVFLLENMRVINPKLVMEDSAAGSFTMTLPPSNKGYDTIIRLATDIRVDKDGEELWSGRVLSESKDFWNNRVLVCEGELAFFNDSTQPPREYPGLSIRAFMSDLIDVHNSKVPADRRFAIGAVTVEDNDYPIRYTNYEKTIELFNALVEQYGGHLRIRKQNGIRYVDYLKDYPDTCVQEIQFGKNLIDFTREWNTAEFATVLVPLGKRLDDSPIEALDAYLTVESVNNGSMYIQSDEAVAAYGWIEKVVTWNDVTDPSVLQEKAKEYLADLQFDNMEIELSALDLHYLDVSYEAVKLLDEIRVVSRPHGLDRMFPVIKMEIPLDSPEQTRFILGDTVKTNLTSVNNQINAAILQKIEDLPKAHNILKEAKENATQIMNMATTGYITITKDEYGSDTLYISNLQDYTKADKLWKWNMNGLGYSNDGGKTYGLAITMDGSIVADYITTGVLNADLIRAGTLRDYGGNFILDMATGKMTMKKGSIDIGAGNFTVDEQGRIRARSGTFGGIVQATDFLDQYGNSMMSGDKFSSDYLDLYGLTIRNRNTGDISFSVSSAGAVTINGEVTMGSGSSINWAAVSNTNLYSNPAYSLANSANTKANQAASDAADAADDAWTAYQATRTLNSTISSIVNGEYTGGSFISGDTIYSPTLVGAEIYWGTNGTYGSLTRTYGSDGQYSTNVIELYSNAGIVLYASTNMRFEGSGLWINMDYNNVHVRYNGIYYGLGSLISALSGGSTATAVWG